MSIVNRSQRDEIRQLHGVIVDRRTVAFDAIVAGKPTQPGIGKTPMKIHV
jgi:hypothetical protein